MGRFDNTERLPFALQELFVDPQNNQGIFGSEVLAGLKIENA